MKKVKLPNMRLLIVAITLEIFHVVEEAIFFFRAYPIVLLDYLIFKLNRFQPQSTFTK